MLCDTQGFRVEYFLHTVVSTVVLILQSNRLDCTGRPLVYQSKLLTQTSEHQMQLQDPGTFHTPCIEYLKCQSLLEQLIKDLSLNEG